MKIVELIAGCIAAILTGALLGYFFYRCRIIIEKRRLTRNVDKKIEKQEKRELSIGGVKVEKNRSYITGGKKVDPRKEAKIQKKEVEIEQLKDKVRKIANQKPKDEKNIKKKKRKADKTK